MGFAVISDERYIRKTYYLDGGSMEYRRARQAARRKLRKILENADGCVGAVYPVAAICSNGKVAYSSRGLQEDPELRCHEKVHVRARRMLRNWRWRTILPLEESMAYAIQHHVNSKKGEDRADDKIKAAYESGKHSLRLIQCIEHKEKNGIFSASLRALYASADQENKNLAWALDAAANFMFYRECLAVLDSFGLKEGANILFSALMLANKAGLETAWQFLLGHLTPMARIHLKDEVRVAGNSIVVRSPFAPHCHEEDVLLT